MDTTRISVLDLFSGVGGLSYGFEHSDVFQVAAANEILRPMAEAYRLNHPNVVMFEGDIHDLDRSALKSRGIEPKKIEVIVGGPPCQAYSTVGKRLLDDPRGALFQEYYRLLRDLRPKIFIFENVKGLVSMNQGELLPTIVKLFETLDYKVQFRVLNAADYGAPQIRERVIIVGTLPGINFQFPDPSHGAPLSIANQFPNSLVPWLTLRDAISDLPPIGAGESSLDYSSEPANAFQREMRLNAPKILLDHNAASHNKQLLDLIRRIPEGGSPRDIPEQYRPKSGFANTYCRLWWDRPSTTVTRNLGTPSSSRCIHPKADRGLTTREGARIQCFPDSYQFFGSRSERNLQIGNAVPTRLSTALSRALASALSIE